MRNEKARKRRFLKKSAQKLFGFCAWGFCAACVIRRAGRS
jgi:hypothetical protein